ncbi:MAG: hypothetical protein KDA44_07215 [Planctomycetales bacterium]|nr:hypothetical protein [Planctomycetales bacterium]
MTRNRWLLFCLLSATALFGRSVCAADAWRPEQWLPATTLAWAGTESLPALTEAWVKTDLGSLLSSDDFAAFEQQLAKTSTSRAQPWRDVTGFDWNLVRTLCRGGLSVSISEMGPGAPATLVIVEVDPDGSAGDLIEVVSASLERDEFRVDASAAEVGSRTWRRDDGAVRAAALVDNLLLLGDSQELIADVIARRSTLSNPASGESTPPATPGASSLADVKAFQAAFQLAARDADASFSQRPLRFFVDAIGLDRLYSEQEHPGSDPAHKDFSARHGLDSLRGAAGLAYLNEAGCDWFVRSGIYVEGPRTKAMQLFDLVNADVLQPPPWMPDTIAAYTQLSWKLAHALPHIGPMFDDSLGEEGLFEEVLEDWRQPFPDGPGVDLQSDLFDHFAPCVEIVGMCDRDHKLGPRSEAMIVSMKISDDVAVADALDRLLDGDDTVARLPMQGRPHDMWRIGGEGSVLVDDGNQHLKFSSTGMTVWNDRLSMSSNFELFQRFVATSRNKLPALADAPDFRAVEQALDGFVGRQACASMFVRQAADFYATYELLRTGQAAEAESIYAQLLVRMLGKDRLEEIDFSTLPPFDASVAPRLGIVGVRAVAEDAGWHATGLSLKNSAVRATSLTEPPR